MKISISELENLTDQAIKHYGYDEKEAKVIKDILLFAQLRGNNQGVVKLIGKGIPKREDTVSMSLAKETEVSALVDGGYKHSMLALNYATELAIAKAKKSGIGIVGTFNTAESTGALAYYVNKIAQEGLIGFAVASAPFATTAPHGSNEAKFCTNPIAYGVPTENEPILLDFSTSAMAYYGLIEAKTAGREVPADTGYDADGNETTDPASIMSGALKTFGGHKGSGLALIVQILAGALVQADSFDSDSDNSGNLVLAIDPNILTDARSFKAEASRIVKEVKAARKLPGVEEILVPGERGNKLATSNLNAGEIEIEDNLLNQLREVAK